MRQQISFFSDPEKNHITGHEQGNIHGNLHEKWLFNLALG